MKVLAFDTTLGACSAAVLCGTEIRAHRFEPLERGHAEALLPMVEEVRRRSAIDYDALDLLAVTVGPGTFTGIRIGLAAARGLALASGVPLAGVTTLEAVAAGLAAEARGADAVLAVLDARRAQVYAQLFDGDLLPVAPPRTVTAARAAELARGGRAVVVGTGAPLLRPYVEAADSGLRFVDAPALPDAAVVARIAARRGLPKPAAPPPAPLYLRSPDATPPAPGGSRGNPGPGT